MTAANLQDALVKELKQTLKDFRHLAPKQRGIQGEDQRIEYNVYAQDLPEKLLAEKGAFPYVIVRVQEGKFESKETQEVTTLLLVGSYDSKLEPQGHRQVINIIMKIVERFRKNPLLEKYYMAEPDIRWNLQEEDTRPIFFGGIIIRWKIKAIEKEDIYA
jgi:hypothetical protein